MNYSMNVKILNKKYNIYPLEYIRQFVQYNISIDQLSEFIDYSIIKFHLIIV